MYRFSKWLHWSQPRWFELLWTNEAQLSPYLFTKRKSEGGEESIVRYSISLKKFVISLKKFVQLLSGDGGGAGRLTEEQIDHPVWCLILLEFVQRCDLWSSMVSVQTMWTVQKISRCFGCYTGSELKILRFCQLCCSKTLWNAKYLYM